MIGGIVAGLNHAMHKMGEDPPRKRKVIKNSKEATEHYFNGGGDVELSRETQIELHKATEYKRVVKRLIIGEAKNLSGSFDVDMTASVFHVGNTNVDYVTTCTVGKCTTTFTNFVRDGFLDPNFIAEKTLGRFINRYKPDGMGPNLERQGGTPYRYIPKKFQIIYKNPGYTITK